MFFYVTKHEDLAIDPKYFNRNFQEHVSTELKKKVENKCDAKYGHCISVVSVQDITKYKLDETTAHCHVDVTYQAVVFRPFKNEVVVGQVTNVNKSGFFAAIGPINVFVHSHMIPNDYEFSEDGAASWIGEDERIEENALVRMKLVGVRMDTTSMSLLGSIRENYLGAMH